MTRLPFIFLLLISSISHARLIHVGAGYAFTSPGQLQDQLMPGDTVYIHTGVYTGTFFIENMNGTNAAPIVIKAAEGASVTFRGGTESFHFSDISYVEISGFTFENQTGNGMNIDDGGSFFTPSHHLKIKNCLFRDIGAGGNNDLLKLSGIDDFTVEACIFQNGSPGGSGIDMVGCHRGSFIRNQFSNQGSNCIQIKGGSADIVITQNKFVNGGARALNIGGSTDLEFFRPQDAPYEASKIRVYANVFEGAMTPFAFVGAVQCNVFNNTIIRPDKWAIRILQETVDPGRFLPSGMDSVINNIFIINSNVNTEVNIGPDTDPGSFYFSNNLWFKENQSSWTGPDLPTVDMNQIMNNPNVDPIAYKINTLSPAYQKGKPIGNFNDFYNMPFKNPPSIGAVENESSLALKQDKKQSKSDSLHKSLVQIYPNPSTGILNIESQQAGKYEIIDMKGQSLNKGVISKGISKLNLSILSSGNYSIKIKYPYQEVVYKWVKVE
ncbi:MAG: T9SS type A sorting domain-containing protein [Saprospiraceae bacterium]